MGTYAARPMIFVTGASRSGTTLLASMLGAHEQIAGLAETHYFGEFWDPGHGMVTMSRRRQQEVVSRLFERQAHGILLDQRRSLIHALRSRPSADGTPGLTQALRSIPEPADAAELFAFVAGQLAEQRGKQIPCEQTPRNVYYARQLLACYPQARFLHMVRDPRGVMASQKQRWRRRSLMVDPSRMARWQQLRTWINYHPYSVARLWMTANGIGFDLRNHPRFLLISFEDLLRRPEAGIRRVCDFLGLVFDPRMLNAERINSSYVSVRAAGQGLSTAPIDAWRGVLSPAELAVTLRYCGVLMRQFGYAIEPEKMPPWGRSLLGVGYLGHLLGAALVNPRRLWIQAKGVSATAGSTDAENSVTDVLGFRCVDQALPRSARELVRCARSGERRRVSFVNAHSVNVSVRDRGLQQALVTSDIVFADGIGMAVAARIQGKRLENYVNGTDLFPFLCQAAADEGVSLAFLGAMPSVVDACCEALRTQYPDLRIAWRHHGYLDGISNELIVGEINAAAPGILLVGMGVPKQERWIRDNFDRLNVPVVIGVGGLFDFVAGRVPRAPQSWRDLRLEWLFRLLMEPRRLWSRYVLGNPLFLVRAFFYRLTGSVGSASDRQGSQ